MLRLCQMSLVAMLLCAGVEPAAAIDPRLLPEDTEILVTINLKQILNSEMVKNNPAVLKKIRDTIEAKMAEGKEGAKYLKEIGFDPLKDLTSITVAHNGTKSPQSGFMAFEGVFDTEKFQSTAQAAATDQGQAFKILKPNLYEISPPNKEGKVYASLLGGKLLVLSPQKEAVDQAAMRLTGAGNAKLSKQIAEAVSSGAEKQSFSFLVTSKAISNLTENANIPNGDQIAAAMQIVDGISGLVNVSKNIAFQFGVVGKDEAGAKKLVAGGNGGLLMIRTLIAQKAQDDAKLAPLVDIVNGIKIQAQGTSMVMRGEITYEAIESLFKSFGGLIPKQ